VLAPAIKEVRLLQSRAPFELVFDDFSTAVDGNLVGQLANSGQSWAVYPPAFTSVVVDDREVVAVDSDDSYARLVNAVSAPNMLATWWLRFKVLLGPVPVDQSVSACWVSTAAGDFYGIEVDDEPGSFTVEAGNAPAFEVITTPTRPAGDVETEFVLQFTTGSHVIDLYMDDVLLGSAAATPAPPGARDFSIELNLGAVAQSPRIRECEFGLGVYAS